VRALIALGGALALAAVAPGAPAPQERIAFASAGELYLIQPDGRKDRRLTETRAVESEPVQSPDGTRIAFVRDGRLVVRPLAEGAARAIASGGVRSPDWAPDGSSLAFERGGQIVVLRLGAGEQRLTAGESPAWSPDGTRIAFTRDGDVHVVALADGIETRLTEDPARDEAPAWSPDGARIAFVSERSGEADVHVMGSDGSDQQPLAPGPGDDRSPSWAPDGARLVFVRDGVLHVGGTDGSQPRPIATGSDPHWGRAVRPAPPPKPRPRPGPPAPRVSEVLPDFDQRAPSGLTVGLAHGRFLLGFTSATDNIGRAAIHIRGFRPHRLVATMRADQVVPLANGRTRVVRGVGVLRYTWSPTHSHWHLLRFQAYELRRASDFRLLVRDRKSGFCLADHYGLARHRVRSFGPPRFLGNCGGGRPDLLTVDQGTSIGYTDRYPAHFHGQNVDVTGVPAGVYVLVHRANPTGGLHERTLANNAASIRLRLSWPHGRRSPPSVRVLRVCEGRERC
jgi:TolB protein